MEPGPTRAAGGQQSRAARALMLEVAAAYLRMVERAQDNFNQWQQSQRGELQSKRRRLMVLAREGGLFLFTSLQPISSFPVLCTAVLNVPSLGLWRQAVRS